MATAMPPEEQKDRKASPRRRIWLPGLSLGISERRLLLGVMDLLVLNIALAAALAFRQDLESLRDPLSPVRTHPEWFVLWTLLWLIATAAFDVYDLKIASHALTSVLAVVKALAVTYVTYLLVPYISPPLPTSRFAGLLLFLFAAGFVVAWRVVYASVFVQPVFRRKVLIVGAGQSGTTLVRALQDEAPKDYQVYGFIDDDPAKQGLSVEGIPIHGTGQDLPSVAEREGVNEIVLAITDVQRIGEPLFRAIMDCYEHGIHVAAMPLVYESVTGRVAVEHIGQRIYLLLPLNSSSTHRIYETAKRLADVVCSIIGLAVFALFLPFIAVAIKLDDHGPVFYPQERVGKGGRTFKLIKLRTMVENAEEDGQAVWAAVNDSRVTRVGRLLRRTRLDEFPQLVSVLKGEMSLIGPRPERPEFVAQLADQIPFYRARHAVKPGLTGWAQVKYRYGNTVEDALVKLQYDLYYIKRRSVYLDLLILARTAPVMLGFRGM